MSDAEKAYEAAKARIAETIACGAADITFDRPQCHALEVIPASISTLENLEYTDFNNIQVTDLSPTLADHRVAVA